MRLDKLQLNQKAIIQQVHGETILRRRLLDMGLTPNTEIEIRKFAPLGDPIEFIIRGYELTLRKEEAKHIEVRVISS